MHLLSRLLLKAFFFPKLLWKELWMQPVSAHSIKNSSKQDLCDVSNRCVKSGPAKTLHKWHLLRLDCVNDCV